MCACVCTTVIIKYQIYSLFYFVLRMAYTIVVVKYQMCLMSLTIETDLGLLVCCSYMFSSLEMSIYAYKWM